VGVTGGIACGKSTVSKILHEIISHEGSVSCIDVDSIAHEILEPPHSSEVSNAPYKGNRYNSAYWKIMESFPQDDILQESPGNANSLLPRKIDRRKLGDIIFKDASKRRKLNSITHPLISKIMIQRIIHASFHLFRRNAPFVIVDIPLLFEAGLKMRLLFGIKVVVATPHYLQLHRLAKRNPELTPQQCEERIASQMPVIRKAKMADIVIWNNQNIAYLEKEVERVFREILNRKRGYLGLSMIHFVLLSLAIHVGIWIGDYARM
jgi:dephospho-CoA kinase